MDIHKLPEQFEGEKHEPTGTSPCHVEVDEAIFESRQFLPNDLIRGPINFPAGINSSEKIIVDDTATNDSCRLLSFDLVSGGQP